MRESYYKQPNEINNELNEFLGALAQTKKTEIRGVEYKGIVKYCRPPLGIGGKFYLLDSKGDSIESSEKSISIAQLIEWLLPEYGTTIRDSQPHCSNIPGCKHLCNWRLY